MNDKQDRSKFQGISPVDLLIYIPFSNLPKFASIHQHIKIFFHRISTIRIVITPASCLQPSPTSSTISTSNNTRKASNVCGSSTKSSQTSTK